ncbi:MAG: hypothetical protein J6R77_05020 [Clostridia bacterium]|nr:hypothetical protein [Clostridia bacterium]
MRRTKRAGSFFLCFFVNLLLNLEWCLPALVLLALHIWLGISLWWFVGGMAFWILSILSGMWIMGWAARCGSEQDPPKENKNPYSVKSDSKEV